MGMPQFANQHPTLFHYSRGRARIRVSSRRSAATHSASEPCRLAATGQPQDGQIGTGSTWRRPASGDSPSLGVRTLDSGAIRLVHSGRDGLPPRHRGGVHLLNRRDHPFHLEGRCVVEPDIVRSSKEAQQIRTPTVGSQFAPTSSSFHREDAIRLLDQLQPLAIV
jgi:hypothetical protein